MTTTKKTCSGCQHSEINFDEKDPALKCQAGKFAGAIIAEGVIADIQAEKCEEYTPSNPQMPSDRLFPSRPVEVDPVAVYKGEVYYSEVKSGAWHLATPEEIKALKEGDRVSSAGQNWVYSYLRWDSVEAEAVVQFIGYNFRTRIPAAELQVEGRVVDKNDSDKTPPAVIDSAEVSIIDDSQEAEFYDDGEFIVCLPNGWPVQVQVREWEGGYFSLGFNGAISPTGFHSDIHVEVERDELEAYATAKALDLFTRHVPRDGNGNLIFDGDRCQVLKGKHKGAVGVINGCVFEGKMTFKKPDIGSFSPSNLLVIEQGERSLQIIGNSASKAIALDAAPAAVELVPVEPQQHLSQLEKDIQAGLELMEQGKARIWQAVAQIQAEELWKLAGHESFEAYCKARWGWQRSNAFEVAGAGRILGELRQSGIPDSDLPTSVSQTRLLAKLPPDQRAEAWREASADGKPTAAKVKAAVQRFAEPPLNPTTTHKDLGISLEGLKQNFEEKKEQAKKPSPESPHVFGALSEIHYAVRRLAKINEAPWDEGEIDRIADHLVQALYETQRRLPSDVLRLERTSGGWLIKEILLSDAEYLALNGVAKRLNPKQPSLKDALQHLLAPPDPAALLDWLPSLKPDDLALVSDRIDQILAEREAA